MSFLSRNPRYAIALVLVLFITAVFLFNNNPISHRPYLSSYSDLSSLRGYKTIDLVRLTEHEYQNRVLSQRRKLIRKFGPLAAQVDPWPTNEYYTLWDFFIPGFQCPHRTARIGALGDGGKWVCGLERLQHKKDCVVYSFGIHGESSFEADILRRVQGCQVWGYDYSVTGFGPELNAMSLSPRAHFEAFALGSVDNHGPNAPIKTWSLKKLMEVNGHQFIDILKIDIEGAEFASLSTFFDFFESQPAPTSPAESPMDFPPSGSQHSLSADRFSGMPLPIGQMQIEIHPRDDDISKDYSSFPAFLAFWERMERLGLRPFWTEPNLVYVHLISPKRPDLSEYSFINIRGRHELLIDELVEEGPASEEDEWD